MRTEREKGKEMCVSAEHKTFSNQGSEVSFVHAGSQG